MRGLSVNILRSDLGDCTNGGVTNPSNAKGKIFVVFDESIRDGNWSFEECQANPDRFVCLQVVRRWGGTREYLHIEPINYPANRIGPMAGGNYAQSSDGRFRALSQYPLPRECREAMKTAVSGFCLVTFVGKNTEEPGIAKPASILSG